MNKGGYAPNTTRAAISVLVTEKKRSEQALIQVVQECWLNRCQRARLSIAETRIKPRAHLSQPDKAALDRMVDEFRKRRLEAEYPVIWVDALYEKIRDNHRIVGKAVMVIKAVNLEGQQEILAVEPMENESEETYSALFRKLRELRT
ncbi:transposase [Treponema parvum]|uniref:transposase n=1 Tax=Treponema parvum TaxID=138851 RepID=UPI001AEC64AA|nr:transposase [Treponema parvum]QTQ16747.1 transposase [Treponema parvum]